MNHPTPKYKDRPLSPERIQDIDMTIFDGMDQEREMFQIRLAELKKNVK